MEKMIGDKRQSEVLCEAILGLDYGEQITHTTIQNLIGERMRGQRYYTVVQKARKMLLEDHKRCLETVREVGYRVTMPDDFVKMSVNEYKHGFKRIQKGANILTNAPVRDMSEEGRTEYRHVYDKTVQLEAALKGGLVEIKTLAKKRENPLKIVAQNN